VSELGRGGWVAVGAIVWCIALGLDYVIGGWWWYLRLIYWETFVGGIGRCSGGGGC
jgi:hypothetical protein